ncbi:MAG: small ribosomal subunit Rsm22 family protein [Bdellovibrionota bacterium]
MKTPDPLSRAFEGPFEKILVEFAVQHGLLPPGESEMSSRFLNRALVPHIERLSGLFNREEKDQSSGLEPYWNLGSNPNHLRLAYFLYFMPCNLYRMASVWAELNRLGYQWPVKKAFKGVEFGAGPAAGACGVAAGEHFAPLGLPQEGNWALIEQDRPMLDLGSGWANRYFEDRGFAHWSTRPFHRKLDLPKGFLPPSAPRFDIWVMSFFLNEFLNADPAELAKNLIQSWDRHLEKEGLIIILEPALKLQSRRLLELRAALLLEFNKKKSSLYQVLLPCLGHQACGALANPEDWCHEEVTWWRPPYFKTIDRLAKLDRKTLPFSYLVISKSERTRAELLPGLNLNSTRSGLKRLVSPAHSEGRDFEFYICGEDGKRRARVSEKTLDQVKCSEIGRGDVLLNVQLRGDPKSSRIESLTQVI